MERNPTKDHPDTRYKKKWFNPVVNFCPYAQVPRKNENGTASYQSPAPANHLFPLSSQTIHSQGDRKGRAGRRGAMKTTQLYVPLHVGADVHPPRLSNGSARGSGQTYLLEV